MCKAHFKLDDQFVVGVLSHRPRVGEVFSICLGVGKKIFCLRVVSIVPVGTIGIKNDEVMITVIRVSKKQPDSMAIVVEDDISAHLM